MVLQFLQYRVDVKKLPSHLNVLNFAAILQIVITQNANVITVIMAPALLATSAVICHFLVGTLVLSAAMTTNVTNQNS